MKLLFVPMAEGWLAHLIPLLSLNRMLDGSPVETAFLLPRGFHKLLRSLGVNVLDIDHNGFRTELKAYKQFRPDVVLDDASLTTGYAAKLSRVPRVTIQRTGMFPGGRPRDPRHRHSMSSRIDASNFPDVSFLGLAQPRSFSDLFEAEVKIVPGIRSIEALPPALEEDPSYFFSGPLIMDDYLVDHLRQDREEVGADGLRDFDLLEEFLSLNRQRKIVYATFGTVARAGPLIKECLGYLLGKGVAVVSNIQLDGLAQHEQPLYYYAAYLPMHFICSNVDLVIHHCGSGTYHYPIIHDTPAVTIGTKCHDRDDVAARLAELGASTHLGAPDECEDFVEAFRRTMDLYLDESGSYLRDKKAKTSELRGEIERTSSSFSLEGALRFVASSKASLN